MKFLKKLATIFIVLLVVAGIFAVAIWMNWDKFSAMPEALERTEEQAAQNAIIQEATKDIVALMNTAYDRFQKENLVEFTLSQVYADTNEPVPATGSRNARDLKQELIRTVTADSYITKMYVAPSAPQATVDGETPAEDMPVPEEIVSTRETVRIYKKAFTWPTMDETNQAWVLHTLEPATDEEDFTTYMQVHGQFQPIQLKYNSWYHYEEAFSDQFGSIHLQFPYIILQADITGYEELGTEVIGGKTATHYLITHKPFMKFPQAFEWQYSTEIGSSAPREYFETATPAFIREDYPELYADFMALMEKRWYQDGQTHVWLTEDGTLLRIIYDYTFEAYEYYFTHWTDEETFLRAAQTYTHTTDSEGNIIEEIIPSPMIRLQPVMLIADLAYGDEVEPIVLPEVCEDLT